MATRLAVLLLLLRAGAGEEEEEELCPLSRLQYEMEELEAAPPSRRFLPRLRDLRAANPGVVFRDSEQNSCEGGNGSHTPHNVGLSSTQRAFLLKSRKSDCSCWTGPVAG